MRGTIVLAAMIISASGLAAAACGQQQLDAPAPARATTVPARAPARCPARSSSQVTSVVINNSDNGQVRCVRVGEQLQVYLTGTLAHKWSPIHSDSGTLTPVANGRLALKVGLTGAFFAAARPGTAHITSTRSMCASGTPSCGTSTTFHVTVVVAAAPQKGDDVDVVSGRDINVVTGRAGAGQEVLTAS